MPRWFQFFAKKTFVKTFVKTFRRSLSSIAPKPRLEHVIIPCASSGSITVTLLNVSGSAPSAPLVVYLPPFGTAAPVSLPSQLPVDGSAAALPSFLQSFPTAIVNYRWPFPSPATTDAGADHHPPPAAAQEQQSATPLHWPTPIHDVSFAYSWLVDKLTPRTGRRPVYVYGSYLGASLATALALTEYHPHLPMAIRGLVAVNGIYNWTAFLPGHPINRPKKGTPALASLAHLGLGRDMARLKEALPGLFKSPSNTFDPFASPSLFFHSPGMFMPSSFTDPTPPSPLDGLPVPASELEGLVQLAPLKRPRKSSRGFPPKDSTLKIPDSLLLFDSTPPPLHTVMHESKGPARKTDRVHNGFKAQAVELAGFMRHSIEKQEIAKRLMWDHEFHHFEHEAERRVQLVDVGPGQESFGQNGRAGRLANDWLTMRLKG